jgi:hypothetical protein
MERDDNTMTTADLARTTRADGAEDERDESQLDVTDDQGAATGDEERSPLLPTDEAADFQERWSELQTSFVDEPRRSVQEGDSLVAELMQRLAHSFAEERQTLEAQWDRGDDVSTEDLRVALQRYRSFFDRLLSA